MPHVIEKTVYHFDELSDKAKEKARAWWRRCEDEEGLDTEFLYEDFERMGKLIGIEFKQRPVKLMGGGTRYEPTIWWSGFSSQGDGACFEGSYSYAKGAEKALIKESGTEHELIRIAKELAQLQHRYFYRLEATVKHAAGFRYYHEHSTEIEVFDRKNNYREIDNDTVEGIKECLRDFMRWMYRTLETEYEYRMADEQVDETIRINEYEFDEDGGRV